MQLVGARVKSELRELVDLAFYLPEPVLPIDVISEVEAGLHFPGLGLTEEAVGGKHLLDQLQALFHVLEEISRRIAQLAGMNRIFRDPFGDMPYLVVLRQATPDLEFKA